MKARFTNNPAILLFLLFCLLAIGVYLPGLPGDYMFDDMSNVLRNDRLELETLDLESLKGATLSSGSGQLRRPVSMLSFALNRYFFGINPYSYKVVNLAIHLLTGLALFLLARLILRSYRRPHHPALPAAADYWLPALVCGIWLVHPLNLTSVLYIVQRMTSLAALFTVCGLCLYVVGRNRMLDGRTGLPVILTGLLVCGGLAVLSKENGALLPLYMLVLEITVFRFRNARGEFDRSIGGFFTLVVLLPACLTLLWLAGGQSSLMQGYHIRTFDLTERVLTEARVLVFYLKLIVMPTIRELGLYHDDIAVSHGLLDPPSTLYAILALAGLLAAALLLVKRQPLFSLGILWFFAGHALESTIFPLEIAHEHRNYLADFGVLLALAALLARLPLTRLRPAVIMSVPLLFTALLAYTTWLRAGQWSDNIQQAIYAAEYHPESFRSVYAAGRIHARLAIAGRTESTELAYRYLDQAQRLLPSDIMPNTVRIKLSFLLGRPVREEWFTQMLDSLERYPVKPATLNSLYELASCTGSGHCDIPAATMEALMARALANPSLAHSPGLQAEAVTIYGYYTINIRGNFPKGRELFTHAVELTPHEAQRWINLIKLLTVMGELEEAEQRLDLFRANNTYGGNEEDYRRLSDAIETRRRELSSRAGSGTQGNS